MKKSLVFIFMVFFPWVAFAQSWIWADNGVGTGSVGNAMYSWGKPMAVSAGEMYATGGFFSSITFDTTVLSGASSDNFFLVKYSQSGSVAWAASATANGAARGAAVSIDTAGNIIVVGTTTANTITFGNYTLTPPGSATPGPSGFVVTFSPSGTVLSAFLLPRSTQLFGIDIDNAGNIYVTGSYSGAPTFGTLALPNANLRDIFVAKYNSASQIKWVITGGTLGQDYPRDMVVNNKGDVFLLGDYLGNSFTLGNTTITNSVSSHHLFLSKLDSSGNVLWSTSTSSSLIGNINPSHLSMDGKDNLYVTGFFAGDSVSFSNNVFINNASVFGSSRSFIAKYDSLGTAQWALSVWGNDVINSPASDVNIAHSSTIDASGNVYVSGTFGNDSISIGGITLARSSSNADGYIVKLDSWGNVLNAFSTSGTSSTALNCWTIVSDGGNGFYAAGTFGGGTPPSNIYLGNQTVSSTQPVPFFAKYGVCTSAPQQPAAISGPATVCAGKQQVYSIPVVTTALSYTWSLPTGWSGTSNTNTITATIGSSGGNVLVSASNLCGTSSPQQKNIVVNPTPSPTITQSGLLLSTPLGQGTYQWYWNNTPLVGATSNSYLTGMNGSFYVRVTNSTNCSDTSNTIVITQVGIEDVLFQNTTIYPQPNNGHFTVQLTGNLQPKNFKVKNVYGLEVAIKISVDSQKIEVDLLNKQPGIYFLSFQVENKQYTEKIIVN